MTFVSNSLHLGFSRADQIRRKADSICRNKETHLYVYIATHSIYYTTLFSKMQEYPPEICLFPHHFFDFMNIRIQTGKIKLKLCSG